MSKDRFLFFKNFKETADKLPDDLRLKFYDAMTDYVFRGIEPDDEMTSILLTAIKPYLDNEVSAWGGARAGAGRKRKNQDEIKLNQDELEKLEKLEKSKESSPHTPHKEIKIKPNGFTKSFPDDFLKFWAVYPKKRAGSRDKAYSAYCLVLKERRATSAELLASAQKYATSEEVARGFAKGCAAWLNDDRFLVSYEQSPKENQFHVEW